MTALNKDTMNTYTEDNPLFYNYPLQKVHWCIIKMTPKYLPVSKNNFPMKETFHK